MKYFFVNDKNIGVNIVIFNLMWMVGCCISRINGVVVGGFVVIGNNV